MNFPLRCPEHTGWRWFLCEHEELANRPIGIAMMVVGALFFLSGLADKL